MAKILVIRLSAIGDVAMTVPVIYSAARSNPDDSFTVLTQAFLIPIFINRPDNVDVIGINTKADEKNLIGLLKFVSVLLKNHYDLVLDLHDIIRTRIIRVFFTLKHQKVYVLNKAHEERRALTAQTKKVFKPLRPVIDRYSDVFKAAGLQYNDSFVSLFSEKPADFSSLDKAFGEKKAHWIGIAPFAKHRGKIYSVDDMEQVVEQLSKRANDTIFLFGGRGYEEAIMEQWAFQFPNVKNVIGRFSLSDELALISKLDVFLCMDSANMHFASLVGTRVVSVWGATHPYAGFYGYHQNLDDAIQETLPCRPCSVYGQKACCRDDYACMSRITPERIVAKINDILQ